MNRKRTIFGRAEQLLSSSFLQLLYGIQRTTIQPCSILALQPFYLQAVFIIAKASVPDWIAAPASHGKIVDGLASNEASTELGFLLDQNTNPSVKAVRVNSRRTVWLCLTILFFPLWPCGCQRHVSWCSSADKATEKQRNARLTLNRQSFHAGNKHLYQ